jgi:hypothetical protein
MTLSALLVAPAAAAAAPQRAGAAAGAEHSDEPTPACTLMLCAAAGAVTTAALPAAVGGCKEGLLLHRLSSKCQTLEEYDPRVGCSVLHTISWLHGLAAAAVMVVCVKHFCFFVGKFGCRGGLLWCHFDLLTSSGVQISWGHCLCF